jgi:Na+/H+ antiporter NhaD/arsenite permease-like protein
MMWIDGVAPLDVLEAFVASGFAMFIFGVPASLQQHRYSPITRDAAAGLQVHWARLAIVAIILGAAIAVNVFINLRDVPSGVFPYIGAGVWVAILATAAWRRPNWSLLPGALKGSVFLLSLIACASLMPVEKLPAASWQTAFGLGFVSSVFDNIPLTALALKQGGYDWGYLAYAVGFGGSMIWFGSSAGVALANMYPQAKSVGLWLKHGWHVAVAYVVGFFVMLAMIGWHPNAPHKKQSASQLGTPTVLAYSVS